MDTWIHENEDSSLRKMIIMTMIDDNGAKVANV